MTFLPGRRQPAGAGRRFTRQPVDGSTIQQNRFVETVRDRTGLDTDDDAETVTVATLRALGVRIAEGQAEDLADRLLDELAGVLSVETEGATELTVEEFVERVENEETEANVEGDTEEHIRAVLETLAETADDEREGVAAQLPESYDRLVGQSSSSS